MTQAVPPVVRERLGRTPDLDGWLHQLAAQDGDVPDVEIPEPAAAAAALDRLGATPRDRDEAIAARPDVATNPELVWLVAACCRELGTAMGTGTRAAPWPHLPERLGAAGRFGYVWVFLAALPQVLRFHAERGIPEEASWEILADLGRQLAICRQLDGTGGMSKQNWLRHHFQGDIYSLGRLQFQRSRLGSEVPPTLPGSPGEPVLGVHIPEAGPLTPAACAESFARARPFFARHFPEETYRLATCGSWLLDDQLPEYLPDSSNIVRFQRMFTLLPGTHHADSTVVEFVFRRIGSGPDFPARILSELPRRTTLERAVVQHLEAGRHWQSRHGWLELEPPPA